MSAASSASDRLRATRQADLQEQIGEIGVEAGLLTHAQLEAARSEGTFPQSLIRDGVLDRTQIADLRRAAQFRVARNEDKALGKLMAGHGYVPESMIKAALLVQRQTFEEGGRLVRLSELMVRTGTLTRGHVVALHKLHKLSFKSPE